MELLPVKQEPPLFGPRRASYKLETRDLSYKLCMKFGDFNWFCCCKNNVEDKLILKNVNCEAMPREITAIAGPSGAGKTTLLEILAGMISPGRVLGQVLVNNQPIDAKRFRRLSGYVPQDDALFPLLTVQEMLTYSALLRLPGGNEEARVSVAKVMKELGLEQIANSRIGQGFSCGISGGERRRVSIGVDLVHDPAVVLIDEPTSGLDSASSLQVVMLLKSIAVNQGKTIVLTIHQPGFRILELFSRLILLSNGLVKHNGSLSALGERLRLAGHHIPRCVNVLEFSIDVIDSLNGYSPYKTNEENLLIKAGAYSNPYQDKVMLIPNSVGKEIGILGQRFFRNIFRTKQLFLTRVIQALLTGLILGTIFLDVGSKTGQVALRTRIGFFAFSLTFLLSSTTEGLPIFLQERRILMRETSRGAYRVSSYVLSNTLVYLPFLLLITLIFSTSVYWLIGLRREIYGFLYFSLVVWVVVLMSDSFVACFSALVPNFIMGSSVIAGLMGSFFLFSGYFISKENIPKYWIFMHYLSLFKYPFECFLINEYGGEEANRRCLDFENGICNLYGSGFLKQQGLMESKKWSNLVVMLGFVLGYRVICFLILWYRCYRSR